MAEKQYNLLKNGGGMDIKYSTTEHIIGKVNENGTIKDLYGITIHGNTNAQVMAISVGVTMTKLYSLSGGLNEASVLYLPWGYSTAGNQWVSAFYNTTNNTLELRLSSAYVNNYPFVVNLEYTKD